MRCIWLALWLLTAVAFGAGADPELTAREVVRRAARIDERNWALARNYTFIERTQERQLDAKGGVKSTESRTLDVTLLEGSPYRRLIARNDQPLSPEDERKEQEKLRRSIEQRRKETPEQRRRRLAEWEKRRQKQLEPLRELPDAFAFRFAADETINSRPVFVIDGTPLPGYKPRSADARFFPKVKGRLWIDKQDFHLVKADAEVIDTISFGVFLARLAKGVKFGYERPEQATPAGRPSCESP